MKAKSKSPEVTIFSDQDPALPDSQGAKPGKEVVKTCKKPHLPPLCWAFPSNGLDLIFKNTPVN